MKKLLSVFMAFVCSVGILSMGTTAQAATLESAAGLVATSSGNLNVRSSASTTASVVASLAKGSYVTLISQSGSWWRVEYADGRYGYCHANYISRVSGSTAATVNTVSGNLNVRSGAGTSYKVTGSLAKGKIVVVLSESNGWSRVLYNGVKTGYVSSQYLSKTSGSDSIQLALPNFKQTDSRWANVLIGNSGKTIGRIGCTKAPNLMTALFLVSTGRGIVIVPRHVRNMVTKDTFVIGISDRDCRFNEYVYYNESAENGAARLFFEEFRAEYIREQA